MGITYCILVFSSLQRLFVKLQRILKKWKKGKVVESETERERQNVKSQSKAKSLCQISCRYPTAHGKLLSSFENGRFTKLHFFERVIIFAKFLMLHSLCNAFTPSSTLKSTMVKHNMISIAADRTTNRSTSPS